MIKRNSTRESDHVGAQVAEFAHGRVPRELRRRQVLAVAGELFVERGFADASMDELARRAGVSKPVIYDLVGSKEALFGEVVAHEAAALADAVQAAVANEKEPEARLYAGALAFFRFAKERREAWDALLTPDTAPANAELAAARRFQAKSVAGLLARGAADLGGAIDPKLLDACAQAVNGAFEALATWWKEHPQVSAETLAALGSGLVASGLRGFFETSGSKRPRLR
jgi:AcrR family transcriptional regulator